MIPGLEIADGSLPELKEMLSRVHAQMLAGPQDLLVSLADEAFAERAVDAFEEAATIPLDPDTLARKNRGRSGKSRRRRSNKRDRRDEKGRRLRENRFAEVTGTSRGSKPLAGAGLGQGIHAALTVKVADAGAVPTALREFVILGDGALTLRWGTRGLVKYSGDHVFGTKHMPARLQLLNPKKHMAEYEEQFAEIIGNWMGEQLSRAGAPVEWIQEVTGGRF